MHLPPAPPRPASGTPSPAARPILIVPSLEEKPLQIGEQKWPVSAGSDVSTFSHQARHFVVFVDVAIADTSCVFFPQICRVAR